MASSADASTTPRVPLSLDRVLRTAIAIADRAGIESLSMRGLAQELGVEAMSLYHYVANKNDLFDGIVDIVVSEIDLPESGPDWKAALRSSMLSAHRVLLRHPWAAALLSGTGVRPARLRHMEALLGRLRTAGFSAEMTHHAYHALDSHMIGFTLWEVGFPAEPELLALATDFLEELPADDYPYLAEHIEQHLTDASADEPSEFEFGLDLVLDALERLLVPEAASRARR